MPLQNKSFNEEGSESCNFLDQTSPRFSRPRQKWKRVAMSTLDKIEHFISSLNELPEKSKLCMYHFKFAPHILYITIGLYFCVALFRPDPSNNIISTNESFGLVKIQDREWQRLKETYSNVEQHTYDKLMFIDEPNVWYQYNYPTEFTCPDPHKIGQTKDSDNDYDGFLGDGKWVCNPENMIENIQKRTERTVWQKTREIFGHKYRDKNGCLIYSIGVNARHIGFETGMQRMLSSKAEKMKGIRHKKGVPFCEIHVFDPAGYNSELVIGDGISYHNWGVVSSARSSIGDVPSVKDREVDGHFKSFQETIRHLGHEGRVVDVMKVDCKMCEWGIYDDWFDHDLDHADEEIPESKRTKLSKINQVLVEVHGTPEEYVNDFFERMKDENYVIFHKDSDTQNFQGTSQDYAFVKMSDEFFTVDN